MSTVTNKQVAVKYRQNVGSLSIDMSADNRTTTLSQHINRHIGRVSVNISTNAQAICRSTNARAISRPIYRATHLGRHIDRHSANMSNRYVGRLSVDMSTDMSVEGCTKYTWSDPTTLNCRATICHFKLIWYHTFLTRSSLSVPVSYGSHHLLPPHQRLVGVWNLFFNSITKLFSLLWTFKSHCIEH